MFFANHSPINWLPWQQWMPIPKLLIFKDDLRNFLNPIQYGLFLQHYGMGGGGIMAPLVTLVFLKVEEQNLVAWGILMCLLKNGINFQIQGFYDIIMTS